MIYTGDNNHCQVTPFKSILENLALQDFDTSSDEEMPPKNILNAAGVHQSPETIINFWPDYPAKPTVGAVRVY